LVCVFIRKQKRQNEAFKDILPKSLKIKTRRNILNGLHAFFTWLKRKGTIQEIPVWPVIKGNDSNIRTAIDYETQIYALSKIPEEHRDVIEFGFETGLRPGETCAIQVRDLENGVLTVQRTWSGSRLRETTKGGSKERLPISQRALELFKKHSKGKLPSAFLFINPETNRVYRPKKLNQLWRAYTGIDITHYEASRHSFCTQIIDSADVFSAQRLMRHKNLASTKVYHHASIKRLEDIVNSRGRVIALKDIKLLQSEK
jgi:integrase